MNNMTSFLIYAKTSKMFKALLQQKQQQQEQHQQQQKTTIF